MDNQQKYSIFKLALGTSCVAVATVLALKVEAQVISQAVANQPLQRGHLLQSEILQNKEAETDNKETEPLDFSSQGRSGQQTAGESRGSCVPTERPLTAIATKNNESLTVASHPQWWFYLPFATSKIEKIEFVLQDENRTDIVRENIAVSATSNYLAAKIPESSSGIKPHSWYRWYLKVYCGEVETTVPLFVSGWVKRVIPHTIANNSEQNYLVTPRDYGEANLWLDAIDLMMSNLIEGRDTEGFARFWEDIIGSPAIDLDLPRPDMVNIAID